MNCRTGHMSHHDYRKTILLQSMTGKVIINNVNVNQKLELQQLRTEYNDLYAKLIDLDNRILILESKVNS